MPDRETLAWIVGAALVVVAVAAWLYWSAPPANPLQNVYGVM